MPEASLVDPQFGIIRVLRPFPDFESVYAGQSALTPIMMTERGQALDQRAGESGFAENLIRGVETPMGSRVVLWVPQILWVRAGDPATFDLYRWTFLWRARNTADFRIDRKPYHFPKQQAGADSLFVIPAGNQSVTYIQTEPAAVTGRAVQNVRNEDYRFGGANNPAPLTPSGAAGVIQQGVSPGASNPSYQLFDMQALGDELLVGVYRDASTIADWTFSGGLSPADASFSNFFSTSDDVGVYISVGTAP